MKHYIHKINSIQNPNEEEELCRKVKDRYLNFLNFLSSCDEVPFFALWVSAGDCIRNFDSWGLTLMGKVQRIQRHPNYLLRVFITIRLAARDEACFFFAKNYKSVVGEDNRCVSYFETIFEELEQRAIDRRYLCGVQIYQDILEKDLAAAKMQLKEMRDKIQELQNLLEKKGIKVESAYDKLLNRKNILQYIREQKLYPQVNQIFTMLLGPMSRMATDEEYNEIMALKQEMLNNCLPKVNNHNDIRDSNIFHGEVNHPTFLRGSEGESIG